ncbi:MAG: cell division protein FtsA, partial [Aquisalinus sp.]|nr:cell division protein FtsA [Aquisalinus sp.]
RSITTLNPETDDIMKDGSLPSSRRSAALEHSTIGVLDIGASKITCFIAELVDGAVDGQDAEIIGVGHQGVSGPTTTGLTGQAAVSAIKDAVAKAQKMAGREPAAWYAAVSGRHLVSRRIAVDLPLADHPVTTEDLQDCYRQGRKLTESEKLRSLHVWQSSYAIDGHEGIQNPLGLTGKMMTSYMLGISACKTAITNLENCLEHCHIKPKGYIAAPYAASLAVLQEEEKSLGAICLDIGANLTGFTLYNDQALVMAGAVALGSDHITRDIAKVCAFDLQSAERAKTLFGTSFCAPGDEARQVALASDGTGKQLSVAELAEIIGPRMEEILQLVSRKIREAGLSPEQFNRIVLTGGGSQLQGLSELVEAMHGGHVRIGRPLNLFGAPEAVSGTPFSVCAGMIRHVSAERQSRPSLFPAFNKFRDANIPHLAGLNSSNPLRKAAIWLRDHF